MSWTAWLFHYGIVLVVGLFWIGVFVWRARGIKLHKSEEKPE